MSYQAKDFSKLLGMAGFSESLLKEHFTLYQGYVSNSNRLNASLTQLRREQKTAAPEFAELRRRYGLEANGVRLHEYYFENLGGSAVLRKDGRLSARIRQEFGSYQRWEKGFRATGARQGSGWVILYQDLASGKLLNAWIGEHDAGRLAGGAPILIMDVFDHAYSADHGLGRAEYISCFFRNIDWEAAEARLR